MLFTGITTHSKANPVVDQDSSETASYGTAEYFEDDTVNLLNNTKLDSYLNENQNLFRPTKTSQALHQTNMLKMKGNRL